MFNQDECHEGSNDFRFPSVTECIYTSCYCEENIWKLCEKLNKINEKIFKESYAIFVTNSCKQIPIWYQAKGLDDDKLVIWDYHVFLVFKFLDKYMVFDFDTILNKPCLFSEYYEKAVRNEDHFLSKFKRNFRVIPASVFLSSFASDRSHMKDINGRFTTPPPMYPPISCNDCVNNLQDFLSVDPQVGVGHLTDMTGFLKLFL